MTRWVLSVMVVLLGLSQAAHAHSLSVAHLDITRKVDGAARVELDLAVRDLALTFPIDANRDELVTWGELSSSKGAIEQWVEANLQLSTTASACALRPVNIALRRYDDGTYASLVFDAQCAASSRLSVEYNLFFDRDPQHRALVTFRDPEGKASSAILHNTNKVARMGNGQDATFPAFLREGVHHILIGYDHLAFLISLLLPAALMRKENSWQATPRFREAFLHTLGIVTAFTAAHSITLTLAALGLVTPASRWIEVAIAGSVLLAALNNLRPVVTKKLWAIGFVFGLIHGFGFAGALGELGLPQGQRLVALLGFNIGVELGQLCVVALLLPLLYRLRNHRWYSSIAMPIFSVAIALMATYWLIQRLGG